MRAHAAFARGSIEMPAVAVFRLRDHVRSFEIPHHDPLGNVLPGEREQHTAACRLAQVNAVFAIDMGFAGKGVFVLFGVLQNNAHPLLQEASLYPIGDLSFRASSSSMVSTPFS